MILLKNRSDLKLSEARLWHLKESCWKIFTQWC